MGRAPCCDKANVKKGPWSPEEDAKLKSYIEQHGTGGNWIALPQKIGLRRCGKSCRLRWLNYLRPNIKHGGFTDEEDRMICSLYVSIGSRWSIIAAQLPGRTDNDIKNYWNTKLKKKLFGPPNKQLKARGSSSSSSSLKQVSVIKSEKIMPDYTNNNNTYCPELPVIFSNQIQTYSEQACFSSMLGNLEGTRRRQSNAEKQIQEETYLPLYPADHTSISQQLCQQSLTNISSSPLNEIRVGEGMHTDYYMNGTNFTNLLVQNSFPEDNVEAILYSIPQRSQAPGQLYEADMADCPRHGASYGDTLSFVEMRSIVNIPLASNCGATEQEMPQVSNFNGITQPGVQ